MATTVPVKKLTPVPTNNAQPQQTAPTTSLTPPNPAPTHGERPLSDIIGQPFTPFDHQTAVVRPFADESARDAAFAQELSAMLLDVMLETHAWAAARPKHESQVAVQKFEKKISEVMEVEKEQGMLAPSPLFSLSSIPSLIFEQTRERLNDFVCSMKNALAALTGLGL
ncbi:hypothetical protein BDZ89DRAFT_793126 [Hymenopellis radicata]|nr:hypothetical protein BDZ89DRAFT_793126 [Hymenopellis radicata]